MTDWTPAGPDPWERARREALAEEGLDHLDRFWRLAGEYVATQEDLAALIRSAGGAPPEGGDGDGARGVDRPDGAAAWTPGLKRFARRRFRRLEETFRAERDGVPFGDRPSRRLDLLPPEVAGKLADRMTALPRLREKVRETERYADALEDALP